MDKAQAALLVSVFWGSLCLGRGLAVPLSIYFRPATLLLLDNIGCIIATVFYALFPDNVPILWITTFVRFLFLSFFFISFLPLSFFSFFSLFDLVRLFLESSCMDSRWLQFIPRL